MVGWVLGFRVLGMADSGFRSGGFGLVRVEEVKG